MFRWTLTNDDTGAIEVLKTDPHGWEEVALEHNRSERYDGIFLDFSLELSFHCKGGGKEFLDAVYKEKGSEGNVTILVEFKCEGHFRRLLEGRIDFSSYREEFKGKTLHTVVDIEKKGITQVVLSRDETDVDLLSETSIGGVALNPYVHAPYTLNSHSKTIKLISKYRDVADVDAKGCLNLGAGGITGWINNPGLNLVSADLDETNDVLDLWTTTNFAPHVERINTAGQPYSYPVTIQVSWNFSGTFRHLTADASSAGSLCEDMTSDPVSVSLDMLRDFDLELIKATSLDTQSDYSNATKWKLVTIPEQSLIGSSFTIPFSASGGITITLDNANEKLWLLWVSTVQYSIATSARGSLWFEYDTAEITFDSNTNSPSTDIKVIAIHEAWSRVCEGITDKTLAFKSEFFGRTNSQGLKYNDNGYGSFTAITDGLRIRGFHQDYGAILTNGEVKKGVITNLKDIYDSCNAIWGIGLGIETVGVFEVVRVEEKDYFYQNTEIYKISNIPGIEMAFQEDMAFSEVHIGYEKWKIENKGGLDEPNTQARWVFPKIKNIKNVKELISPYVAGMYAIEQTRRENIIFNTTGDSDYDDEIFIIALNRNVDRGTPTLLNFAERGWMLGQGIFDNILVNPDTLLAPDTAYNLRFNLFSNFDRTMNQFTTNLTKDSPQQINYSYLEGNGQMEFQVVGFQTPDTHVGNLNNLLSNNVQNTEIPNGRHQRQYPILLPELYTFSFPVPYSDYLDILSNPYGYISFSSTNKNHKKGYIKTMSYNIAKQMADFSLIRKFE